MDGFDRVLAGTGVFVVYNQYINCDLPNCLGSNLSERGGFMVVQPEDWYFDTKIWPRGVKVWYCSYLPGPGLLSAVVNSSRLKIKPGLSVFGRIEYFMSLSCDFSL